MTDKFTTQKPFNYNDRDYFTILHFEERIINKLEHILKNEKGIFILCGNQGVGKSSLKNMALNNLVGIENRLFINIPFLNEGKDLYREILIKLQYVIEEQIANSYNILAKALLKTKNRPLDSYKIEETELTEQDYFELFKGIKQLTDRYSKIIQLKKDDKMFDDKQLSRGMYQLEDEILKVSKILKDNDKGYFSKYLSSYKGQIKSNAINERHKKDVSFLETKINEIESVYRLILKLKEFNKIARRQFYYYDLEVKDTKKYIEETTYCYATNSNFGIGIGSSIMEARITSSDSISKNKKIINESEVTKTITSDIKEQQIFALLKNISEDFEVSIIVDELDKKSNDEILEMINYNKRFFLETNLTVLLITDVFSGLYLSEKSAYIYIENIVLVRSLNFIEFLVRSNSKGLHQNNDFVMALEHYYDSKFNNRRLTGYREPLSSYSYPRGFLLYAFLNSTFYSQLDNLSKEIILNFYWELIDLLINTSKITESEYNDFVEDYLSKNKISSKKVIIILNRLKEELVNNSLNYYLNLPFLFYDSLLVNSKTHTEQCKHFDFYKELNNYLIEQMKLFSFDSGKEFFLEVKTTNKVNGNVDSLSVIGLRAKLNDFFVKNKIDEKLIELNIDDYKSSIKDKLFYRILDKKIRFAENDFYDDYKGVDDAISIVNRENVICAIIFYPYNNDIEADNFGEILRNGIIVTINDFDEVILYPYVGYIGLHSHKPKRLEELKHILFEKNIEIIEIDQNESKRLFKDTTNNGIVKVCSDNIINWLSNLRVN